MVIRNQLIAFLQELSKPSSWRHKPRSSVVKIKAMTKDGGLCDDLDAPLALVVFSAFSANSKSQYLLHTPCRSPHHAHFHIKYILNPSLKAPCI